MMVGFIVFLIGLKENHFGNLFASGGRLCVDF